MSYMNGDNINRSEDRNFGGTMPYAMELNYATQTTDSLRWNFYKYPRLGWSLGYINNQNNLLGEFVYLARSVEFILAKTKAVEFNLKASQGLMYATQVYKPGSINDAHYNNAISQHVNFSEQIGIGITVNSSKRLASKVYLAVMHFSNGAISQPNDGINFLFGQLGLVYKYGAKEPLKANRIKPLSFDKRIKYNFLFTYGITQVNPDDKNKYAVYAGMVYIDKALCKLSKLNLGLDLFANTAVADQIKKDPNGGSKDYKRIGVSAGHEFVIDRLGVLTQVGYFIYSPYPVSKKLYEKFGVKYFLNGNLYIAGILKVDRFMFSDNLTFGVGLRI